MLWTETDVFCILCALHPESQSEVHTPAMLRPQQGCGWLIPLQGIEESRLISQTPALPLTSWNLPELSFEGHIEGTRKKILGKETKMKNYK